MPDLLTCVTIAAKIVSLTLAVVGWIVVGLAMRFTGQPLKAGHTFLTATATALFIGLMGWLD